MFYETVVLKHVESMFGWIDTAADKAVKKVFNSVLKAYVLNPDTYISEFDIYRYRDAKITCSAPTVMAHFIYSGVKTTEPEEESHRTICFASHFSSTNTSRCIDKQWHTHELVAMPVNFDTNSRSHQIKEDTRVTRIRYFKHFIRTFGRRCEQCVALSKSVNHSRQLRCDSPNCRRYVKFNGKWNLDAVTNAIRYVVRGKLEGIGQKKWVFSGTSAQRLKRFQQVGYPQST